MAGIGVRFTTRDGATFDGYLSRPKDGAKAPGILPITAIFGVDQEIRELADAWAADGFLRVGRAGLSRRELARRLGTSVPQLYRLLDPANTRKSLGQLVSLLHLLDCDVQLVVNPRHAA